MGIRPKQTFLQRIHTNGQKAYEKIFNIANYQNNTNQKYNELQNFTPFKMSVVKNPQTIHAEDGMKIKE